MKKFGSSVLALGVQMLFACGEGGEDDEGGRSVEDGSCTSGLRWAGGDEESPLMHPGGDCIGCHTSEGEGPSYVFAGTVFKSLTEGNDCYGVDGVQVVITDSLRHTFTLETNGAGNFFLEDDASVSFPITAKVTSSAGSMEMVTAQPSGACATCHTETGANGAPGRIIVP